MNLKTSRSTGNVLALQRQFSQGIPCGAAAPLRKSASTSNCVIVSKRGFKPSDRYDPHKREFLTSLTAKLWHVSLDESSTTTATSNGLLHNKPIDLEKLFTPASDSGEATPSRNRKMYASSSFYSPHHPTVEDQVELARRISNSLCDISNQQSKGQSMYVNRMKRSVKWVHEGQGKQGGPDGGDIPETPADDKLMSFKIPNVGPQEMKFRDGNKPALKLVMDPRGQIQDISSLRRQGYNIEPGSLSPEVAFDLVRDLNAPRGKGAELFAKRRKKSEKWVVDENTVKMSATSSSTSTQILSSSSSSSTNILQHQTSLGPSSKAPPPIPSYLDTRRAEHTQKLNEIQERFTLPRLRMVKSPWEAALATGSVDTAFQEFTPMPTRGQTVAPAPDSLDAYLGPLPTPVQAAAPAPAPVQTWTSTTTSSTTKVGKSLSQRVSEQEKGFLYMPKAPRGWGPQQTQQQQTHAQSTAANFGYEAAPQPQAQPQPQPPQQPVARTKSMYSSLNNYNTAPRGWGQGLDYYRPVTFIGPTRVG